MPDTPSGSWRPEVGERRTVTVEIDSNGGIVIVEPSSTKSIELQAEYKYPPGTILDIEIEITETAGLTGVIAEPVGDVPRSVELPAAKEEGPTRQELLDELRRLAADLDKIPTTNDVASRGKYDRAYYLEEFDSFITALKEAKLEPTELQYRFSSEETPAGMQGTANVEYLREHGPATTKELPKEISMSDKRHGAAKFSIYKNVNKVNNVYYLMDDHEPEAVIRKFFDENPGVVENTSRKALTGHAGDHGKEFGNAASRIVEEYKSDSED